MKNCGQSAILVFLFKLNWRKRERTERLLRRLRWGWLCAEKIHQRKMKWSHSGGNRQNGHCNNTPVDSFSIVWACRDGNISRSSYQRAVLLKRMKKKQNQKCLGRASLHKHSVKNKILKCLSEKENPPPKLSLVLNPHPTQNPDDHNPFNYK